MAAPDPDLRRLLIRCDLAFARRRAGIARRLALGESELAAATLLLLEGEFTASRLAARLDLSSGGATQLIGRLERAGHVRRVPHPTDGRSQLLRLSDALATRLEAELPVELGELSHADGIPALLTELVRRLDSPPGGAEPRRSPGRAVPGLWG